MAMPESVDNVGTARGPPDHRAPVGGRGPMPQPARHLFGRDVQSRPCAAQMAQQDIGAPPVGRGIDRSQLDLTRGPQPPATRRLAIRPSCGMTGMDGPPVTPAIWTK